MNNFKKLNLIGGWLVFAIAATVYILTMEPTTSLWDCAEFVATSYKLEVGHPPGAPLFMMIARLFTIIGGTAENAALMVNLMSSLASAFTILLLFWSTTHLASKLYAPTREQLTKIQALTVIGAGAIGALAYTFTDTFWFSAIEGEVYAMSSLFTALVFWAILQWENVADKPHSTRWLILIAYLMGLSIGVHILNLLAIPALVFVYYFKKTPIVTKFGVLKAFAISCAILLSINSLIIPYTVAIGAWFDKIFVNSFDLPVNSGITFFALAIFALAGWGIYYTDKKGKVLANTIVLCLTVILLGYGSYASVVIRASANPPMNSNDPSDPYSLLRLLNREQYGSQPLLKGQYYSTTPIKMVMKTDFHLGEDGKYHEVESVGGYEYIDGFETLFPRMYSSSHAKEYIEWADVKGKRVLYGDKNIIIPTFGENVKFFFNYQLNFMYWRYFLWNFVGRQNNIQGSGDIENGNWLSGINAIDQLYLGPQENLSSEMAENEGRNTYFFLPFILGIIGLIFQLNRDKKNFSIVMLLFFLMGIALVIYFNSTPSQPRERDYVFAGSFYAFCIWIGIGVISIKEFISKWSKKDSVVVVIAAIAISSSVPIILAVQNWDDHDRSGRYLTRDIGANYLNTTLPNSIIMNYGDNDTFPLWYSQEVEGVRDDVRIMNLSYLNADWYIDQMKIKANESDAVPFSLSRSKYSPEKYIPITDIVKGKRIDIATAVAIFESDNPATQLRLYGDELQDVFPSNKLFLTVNKENAIASGIVSAEDAHLMVDTINIDLPGESLNNNELMLLDLLANFDWKRPLYFTQPNDISKMGFKEYLQFDGLAYRLVPIKTAPVVDGFYGKIGGEYIGRIDSDYLYNKLMNEFKYGNLSDPDVYIDNFITITLNASGSRIAFVRLAKTLIAEGDSIRAVEVLDRGLAEMPISKIKHNSIVTIPIIEAYYAAKAFDKGNAVMDDYIEVLEGYIRYYSQFPNSKAELVSEPIYQKMSLLYELYSLALANNQQKQVDRIAPIIGTEE